VPKALIPRRDPPLGRGSADNEASDGDNERRPCHPNVQWRFERARAKISNKQPRGNTMVRKIIIVAASAAVLALSPAAFAQQTEKLASGAEAKEMLQNAVTAVVLDNQKAIDMFNSGEGGFLYRDTYVFCTNVGDGKFVATGNPNAKTLLGQDIRTLKDATGKAFGQELYDAGQKPEGEITEVDYLFAKPTDPKPVPKATFVTRVGAFACGVGYYK
jgi:hypothetical protein